MWRCDLRPTADDGGRGAESRLGGTEAVAGGVAGEAGATGAERLAVTHHPHEAGKAHGAGPKRNENTPAGFKPGHVAQGCWRRPRRWSRTETALAGTAGATPGYRRGDVAWRPATGWERTERRGRRLRLRPGCPEAGGRVPSRGGRGSGRGDDGKNSVSLSTTREALSSKTHVSASSLLSLCRHPQAPRERRRGVPDPRN